MSDVEYVKCDNGHLYDPEENQECPYCPRPTKPHGGSETVPSHKTPAVSPTVVVDSGSVTSSDSTPTVVEGQEATEVEGATVVEQPVVSPPTDPSGGSAQEDEGDRKTRVLSEVESEKKLSQIFAWLVVLEGQQQYEVFRIDQEQTYIGGSEKSDIVLNDDFVSSEHASIRYREGQFFITDLDSRNGTFVNDFTEGEGIDRVELKDGDDIKMGEVLIKFKCI